MATGADGEVNLASSKMLAVAELLVSLHKFVNIELHAQGWYAVRVSIQPDAKIKAIWPSIVESGDPAEKPTPKYAAVLDQQAGFYQSRIFRVRYCYEEASILETVSFHLYVSDLQLLEQFSCSLEVELLLHEADVLAPDLEPGVFQLRSVSKEVLRISRVATGMASYHAATFDTHHFGLCHIGVFAIMRGLTTTHVLQEELALSRPLGVAEPVKTGWSAFRSSQLLCRTISNVDLDRGPAAHSASASGGAGGGSGGGGDSSATPFRKSVTSLTLGEPGRPPHLVSTANDSAVRQALQEMVDAPVKTAHGMVAASDQVKMDRVGVLYTATLAAHQAARQALVNMLRHLPASCYAPQNFASIRAAQKVKDVHDTKGTGLESALSASLKAAPLGAPANFLQQAAPHGAGAAPNTMNNSMNNSLNSSLMGTGRRPMPRMTQSDGGNGAVAGSRRASAVEDCGDLHHSWPDFQKSLPPGCSPGAALLYLEGVLQRLRQSTNLDWAVLLWVLRNSPKELHQWLKTVWEAEQADLVAPWLALDAGLPPGLGDARCAAADAFRKQMLSPGSVCEPPRVASPLFWDRPAQQPILFVDSSKAGSWTDTEAKKAFGNSSPEDEAHVVVFVHGFQGAATDLCLIKGHLSLMYPYLECFSSKVNEGNTHDAIEDMGGRLAQELVDHLTPFLQSRRRPLTRLSFVGHSIGNLILRAALAVPSMAPFLPLLWLYISISGPHLGFLYSLNAVLDTGMRVLKSLGRGRCLHQLSFTDASNQRDCYLYKLSQEGPGLSAFRHVLLVFSPQDRYVPFHSARISMCEAALKDGKKGGICQEIVDALMKDVGGPGQTQLLRVDVDFELAHKAFSFSKMVGRTAHIEFIESDTYIRFLMWGVVHRNQLLPPATHAWL